MESRERASTNPRRKRPWLFSCFTILGNLSGSRISSAFTLHRDTFRIRDQPKQLTWRDTGLLEATNPSRTTTRRYGQSTSSNENPAEPQSNVTTSFFSPNQLSDLKYSISIIDVVESFNLPNFQRRGDSGAISICPFHDDWNPSMSIDDKRKLFKCFSCGAGGDVFKFVRDYSALQGEEMTFYESVRKVASENGKTLMVTPSNTGPSRMTDEEKQALQMKKQRLILIHAAAAAYFGTLLVSLSIGGQARSHLRTRGLSPTTVRTFALGYAPECYFGLQGNSKWGEGSLVSNLKNLGFTPDEIVDSGLATRTKRTQRGEKGDALDNENPLDFTALIDRFRGRIMVPIFDASGKQVIAFGGRILPSLEQANENSDFKPPKYLNSPESVLFHKTNELFGLCTAKEAIQEQKEKAAQSTQRLQGSIVIVEGYMDAITLWEANIKESVACMGTALTMEQLASAAKAAGTMGGRIILCFDNDEAGINAVERVCSNMFLSKTSEKYVVEIVVASLPADIKDPADFVQARKGSVKGGIAFREEVISNAVEWTTWYLKRILSRYNDKALRGTPGSFGDMCDRVSEFLATFPNPADRTKRAFDVAHNLAEVIAGSGEVSKSFRIQLETDLVDMVARKAAAKESLGRRIEAVDGVSMTQRGDKLAQMLKGSSAVDQDDANRLSSKAFKAANPIKARIVPNRVQSTPVRVEKRDLRADRKARSDTKAPINRGKIAHVSEKRQAPPMTQHFKGFDFENTSDAEWLGLPTQKSKRKKGDLVFGRNERYQKIMLNRFGAAYAPGLKDNIVFFNSNEFHGQNFLTQEAIDAGYTNNNPQPQDRSFLERGVATLIKEDPAEMIMRGEETLLRNLVQYGSARSAMQTAIASSEATGSRTEIEWSSHDRLWLFTYLVEREDQIPSEYLAHTKSADLREFLATREDVPEGAFGTPGFSVSDTWTQPNNGEVGNIRCMDRTDTSKHVKGILTVDATEMNNVDMEPRMPSESVEIDDWASSFDPSDFDDDSTYGLDTSQNIVATKEFKSTRIDDDVIDAHAVPDDTEQRVPDARATGSELHREIRTGSLDHFFIQLDDIFAATYDESVPREKRAELEVQEALATLLKASALKRLESVNANWLAASKLLDARLESPQDADKKSSIKMIQSGIQEELDSMTTEELQVYCQDQCVRLAGLFQTAHQLEASWQHIKSRIFSCIAGDSAEGKMSAAKYDDLVGMVDEFLDKLPADWQPKEIDDLLDPEYVLSLYDSDDPNDDDDGERGPASVGIQENLSEEEKFERDMVMIDTEWSEWDDPDYRWSPDDNNGGAHSYFVGKEMNELEAEAFSNEPEESLEEAMARIDNDWADWIDDNVPDNSNIAASTPTQQPVILRYPDAEVGEYADLKDPSNLSAEADNAAYSNSMASVVDERRQAMEENVNDELGDVEPNFSSVWE